MSNLNQNHISWKAAEFRHYPKNMGWYVTLISVSILVIAFFVVVEGDIFAAVSLGIVALIIIFFSGQTPQNVDIALSGKGVHFGTLFYPYKQLKFFWVVNNPKHRTLNFHTSALINNMLILELEDQDAEKIRKHLIQFLPEHPETEETTLQKIMHKLKF